MKNSHAILIGLAIIIGSIIIAYGASVNGRYNIVQRGDTGRMTLIDTRTGGFQDITGHSHGSATQFIKNQD